MLIFSNGYSYESEKIFFICVECKKEMKNCMPIQKAFLKKIRMAEIQLRCPYCRTDFLDLDTLVDHEMKCRITYLEKKYN